MKEDDDLGTESSRSALKREDTKKKRKKKTRKKGGKADIKSSEDNQEVSTTITRVTLTSITYYWQCLASFKG